MPFWYCWAVLLWLYGMVWIWMNSSGIVEMWVKYSIWVYQSVLKMEAQSVKELQAGEQQEREKEREMIIRSMMMMLMIILLFFIQHSLSEVVHKTRRHLRTT